MDTPHQIQTHLLSLSEPKSFELQTLHHRISTKVLPGCKLWFSDGKNDENKVVTNPTIGYGSHFIKYANGTTREFFQIGMSGNTTGISISIIGIKDKTYLAQTFGKDLGKASVTGYCIKFKTVKDINVEVLEAAIRWGAALTSEK
ncbi:MAG: DUF1801 domain-containing protein [Bacteroidota bacterium]